MALKHVDIEVVGIPAPQGSKTRTRHGGIREDSSNLLPWRATIAAVAQQAMQGHRPLAGPLALYAAFSFPRPKYHYGTGRNEGKLKPNAPNLYAYRPDLDKLIRAVCDAITGIVCVDDSQIVEIEAVKGYGTPGLSATVYQLER